MSFRIAGSRVRHRGGFLEYVEIDLAGPNGDLHLREVVRHPGGVAVVPFIDGDVVLVRQYRVAVDRPVLEIPAGKREPGEAPINGARRELTEELGMEGTLRPLGSVLVSPGWTDEDIHLFSAVDIVSTERRPDGVEESVAETVRIPLDDALRSVESGEITDAKTQIALLRLERSLR